MTACFPNIEETLRLARLILNETTVNGFIHSQKFDLQHNRTALPQHLAFGVNRFYDDFNLYPFYSTRKQNYEDVYLRLVSDIIKICQLNQKLKQSLEDVTAKLIKSESDYKFSLEKNAKVENEFTKMADRLKTMQETINNLKCEKETQKDSFNLEASNIHQKHTSKLKELQLSHDKAVSEKNEMVLKYARSEKEVLDCRDKYNRLNDLNKQEVRLRDNLNTKLKNTLTDLNKTTIALEERTKEASSLRRELVREKEDAHNIAVTLKWTQNKLGTETENHKETKRQLENTMAKFAELQTDIKQITLHEQIEKSDFNQPPSTNSLLLSSDSCSINSSCAHELIDQNESQSLVNDGQNSANKLIQRDNIIAQVELGILRKKHSQLLRELENTKAKVMLLESDLQKKTIETQSLKTTLVNCQQKCTGLNKELDEAKFQLTQCQRLREELDRLREKMKASEDSNRDLMVELKSAQEREKNGLEFMEGISVENAKIAGELGYLREKVDVLSKQNEDLSSTSERLNCDLKIRMQELASLKLVVEKEKCENGKLNIANNALSTQLSQLIEEHRNEIKLLKKKYLVCSKDLANHLKTCGQQGTSSPKASSLSENNSYSTPVPSIVNEDREDAISRISSLSISSLTNHYDASTNPNAHEKELVQTQEEGGFEIVEDPSSSIRLMVEKTLRLQKSLSRKRDKIEFLNDHIIRLQEEVQKKAKIIQTLLLHEHSGALTTEEIDGNKALMAQKSGIMASIYNPLKVDRHMTLELSMDINKKLQNLLEDSLLKIIVLKEGMENLGVEISRLLLENKNLKEQIMVQKVS